MSRIVSARRAVAIVAFVVLAAAAAPAAATAQRTFVASNGSDANPCSLAQPCRSFGAAIVQTNANGEVIVLDSAGYGPATITQAVSIIAPPGVYAGISVFSGNGITVNGAGIVVTLRGLAINGQGTPAAGISFDQGAKLVVEDCEIANGFVRGIHAVATNGLVTVKNTVLRANFAGFAGEATTTSTLDNVGFYGNATAALAGTNSRVAIHASTFADNDIALNATAGASGSGVNAMVSHSFFTREGVGMQVSAVAGATARMVADGNTLNEFGTAAFKFLNSGGTEVIVSYGNNALGFGSASVQGGALTSSPFL